MNPQDINWNERYVTGDAPWDNNTVSTEMQRVLREWHIAPTRMLELGCGTGTNAVYFAQQGFDVTGFDLSPLAIEKAEARAKAAGVNIAFHVADVFNPPDLGGPFQFAFDRGVYHSVRGLGVERFVANVAKWTTPGSFYLTLTGNANDPSATEGGPPRVSAEEICRELAPSFAIVQLREFVFDPVTIEGKPYQPLGWSVLSRRK